MKIKIAASILAANPMRLEEDVNKVQDAGVDLIHVDIMDGHFVPNLTMGPFLVEGLKHIARVPMGLHLMVEYPSQFIKPFRAAANEGDFFVFHIESKDDPREVIRLAKEAGFRAGISLNPPTHPGRVEELLGEVDMLLVMSVNPGFAGQKFIPEVLPKLKHLRDIAPEGLDIEIDGGITEKNVALAAQGGANVIAAASAIFKAPDPSQALKNLRHLAQEGSKLTVERS
ncbi:MAG: ribulose-phosphate 3-epimerase [Candidatus Brocadiales bacterium]